MIYSDFESLKALYSAALEPLGYKEQITYPGAIGLGPDPKHVDFWLATCKKGKPITAGLHFAFEADSHEVVDAVHAAAM